MFTCLFICLIFFFFCWNLYILKKQPTLQVFMDWLHTGEEFQPSAWRDSICLSIFFWGCILSNNCMKFPSQRGQHVSFLEAHNPLLPLVFVCSTAGSLLGQQATEPSVLRSSQTSKVCQFSIVALSQTNQKPVPQAALPKAGTSDALFSFPLKGEAISQVFSLIKCSGFSH